MIKVAPSMLAADYMNLGSEIDKVVSAGADALHFDVMDGSFVPAISFGQEILKAVAKKPIPADVHLMICNPEKHIDDFADAGARYITVHAEASPFETRNILKHIRERGCLAGVSIKPNTMISAISEYIDLLDLILVMTVEPGKGGQKLIPFTIEKARALSEMCKEAGVSPIIEADGGINSETAKPLVEAGVTMLVTGSAFFKAPDPTAFVKALKALK